MHRQDDEKYIGFLPSPSLKLCLSLNAYSRRLRWIKVHSGGHKPHKYCIVGSGGEVNPKILEAKYEASLEFLGGEGVVQNKKPSVGGVRIFSKTTRFHFSSPGALRPL